MVRVTLNHEGMRRMLKSPEMQAAVEARAREIEAVAVATAPVRTGHYASSFEVHKHEREDRAAARVVNTDPAALSIEFGARGSQGHYTLTRALDAARGAR